MIIDIAKDGTEIKEITEINEKLEKALKDSGLIIRNQEAKLVNVRGKFYIELVHLPKMEGLDCILYLTKTLKHLKTLKKIL